MKDHQQAHIVLGEMQIRTNAACDLARLMVDRVQNAIHRNTYTYDDRLGRKGELALVSRMCRDTMNDMMGNLGASSYHHDHAIQRFWRDINMVSAHAFWDWDATRELHGRKFFGLSPDYPLV